MSEEMFARLEGAIRTLRVVCAVLAVIAIAALIMPFARKPKKLHVDEIVLGGEEEGEQVIIKRAGIGISSGTKRTLLSPGIIFVEGDPIGDRKDKQPLQTTIQPAHLTMQFTDDELVKISGISPNVLFKLGATYSVVQVDKDKGLTIRHGDKQLVPVPPPPPPAAEPPKPDAPK